MRYLLLNLREWLSPKELAEAEARARACRLSLDEWLVRMFKTLTHGPSLPGSFERP